MAGDGLGGGADGATGFGPGVGARIDSGDWLTTSTPAEAFMSSGYVGDCWLVIYSGGITGEVAHTTVTSLVTSIIGQVYSMSAVLDCVLDAGSGVLAKTMAFKVYIFAASGLAVTVTPGVDSTKFSSLLMGAYLNGVSLEWIEASGPVAYSSNYVFNVSVAADGYYYILLWATSDQSTFMNLQIDFELSAEATHCPVRTVYGTDEYDSSTWGYAGCE